MSHGGRCECGGVAYEVAGDLRPVINCHCHRCRRFTGHHLAATAAPRDAVTLTSAQTLKWFSPDGTVGYGFCSACGSSLFWRAGEDAESVSIMAGTLDQPTGLRTVAEWWMTEHGDYFAPEPGTEPFAHDG